MENRLTPDFALASLKKTAGRTFITLFRHGTLEVEFYKPDKVDFQTPHARDEIYVVVSGSGTFVNGRTRQPFAAGEVLFVPAGVDTGSRISLTTSPRGCSSTVRRVAREEPASAICNSELHLQGSICHEQHKTSY